MFYTKKTLRLSAALILFCLLTAIPVAADPLQTTQNQKEEDFTYSVQPDDTLTLIALRYDLNFIQVALANDLFNPNLIFPGQQLILPGVATLPPPLTATSPSASNKVHIVQPGETVFSIANLHSVSIGSLITVNDIQDPNVIQVGQIFQIPAGPPPTVGPLRPPFEAIELSETTIIQGRTLIVKVTLAEPATLRGLFEGYPLFFYGDGNGQFWALVAIHALSEPKIYPLRVVATLFDGKEVTQFENVTVIEGPYGQENIQLDEGRDTLLDADLIALEREKLADLWSQVTLRPRWEGPFWFPVAATPPRITSYFGTRRNYNNSTQLSFHGGTDFGGGIGSPINAPAAGIVVLAEPLTVRGNAVLIDHGMGLFSGYWHQDQIVVSEGQEVEPGDLIGYIGNSGLVTGPHLHWELRLNGIAIDPLQWVRESIP
jgi:murein DD-endopeptidase MepM/ murein hydrolase activator NlpD